MTGYYLMHRGWMDHVVFGREPYTKAQAWAWLIEQAAWQPRQVSSGSRIADLQRGQLYHSLRYMAKAWKWEESKVRRFLKVLQNHRMIAAVSDAKSTQITICNYEVYQDPRRQLAAPVADNSPHKHRSDAANKKEDNSGIQEESEARARAEPDPLAPDAKPKPQWAHRFSEMAGSQGATEILAAWKRQDWKECDRLARYWWERRRLGIVA